MRNSTRSSARTTAGLQVAVRALTGVHGTMELLGRRESMGTVMHQVMRDTTDMNITANIGVQLS